MANITVRNLDDELVMQLKQRARSHNRSLEAEVRHILAAAANPHRWMDLRELADRIAAMTPRGQTQSDSSELLREDRDR